MVVSVSDWGHWPFRGRICENVRPSTAGLGGVVAIVAISGLLAASAARAETPPTSPGAHQRTLETSSGFELRYTVWIPDGYPAKTPSPLVLSLHHGFDRSRPYPEYFGRGMLLSLVVPGLERLGAVIVAPDSHGKRWSDETIEASVVELVARVQADYAVDAKRIAVVGFSMGGSGCWEYAARHPGLFTAVIPIASRVDKDTAKAVKAPIFAIHSHDDGRIPIEPVQLVIGALQRMGRDVEFLVVTGLQHHETPRYREPLARAVPWLKGVWD